MLNNVTKLHVEPKTVHETYRRQSITVKFLPDTMTWQWEIEFTARLQFDGEDKSVSRALSKARKQIDKLLGE